MMIVYSLMVVVGIAGIGFCFWAQGTLKSPYDVTAVILLPFSLILGLIGVLLLCVPKFFG
ncbi:MAG: hypothetical protein ACE5FY_06280 [Nitrospiria bacterium]